VSIIEEPKNCKSNYWLQALTLDSPNLSMRDSILENLNSAGYMSRPGWDLLNSLDPFTETPSMSLETSNLLFQSLINIPSSPNLVN
jgi:perosamine synthetase